MKNPRRGFLRCRRAIIRLPGDAAPLVLANRVLRA
jgi:hypothetical protein